MALPNYSRYTKLARIIILDTDHEEKDNKNQTRAHWIRDKHWNEGLKTLSATWSQGFDVRLLSEFDIGLCHCQVNQRRDGKATGAKL